MHSKVLAILIITASALGFAFFAPINFLINFAHDDSFFYLKTAFNFSKGYGSTFDQVNITNGYQPLWFIILAAYFFILNLINDFTPESIYRFTVFLQIIISGSAMYFTFKFFKSNTELVNYRKKFLLFIPLFMIFVFTRDFGMESQLTCLIFSIYCYLKTEELNSGKSFDTFKSILLCLLFLARVDYLFSVIPFIIFYDFYCTNKKAKFRFFIFSSLMVSITSLSYFIFNKFTYGNYLTISAVSKNTFPELVFIQNINNMTDSASLTVHLMKAAGVLFVILFFLFSNKKSGRIPQGINIFLFGSCCGTLLYIFLNLCFNNQGLREWYVTFPTFTALLLVLNYPGSVERHFKLKFTMLIIICSVYFYLVRMNNFKWDSAYDYALNLKKITSGNDRIFQIDFSGVVGFFSERKLINGDGLINSFEYREYILKKQLKEYLKNKEINLYSTNSDKEELTVADSSGFYIDRRYAYKFGGYDFKFPEDDLLFKMPFTYDHALKRSEGEWYLFKISE